MSDYSDRHYLQTMLMVRRGKISLVDDSGVIQKVQLPPSGLETRDNLARIVEYGLTSNPPEGTDAYLINVGGDPSNGAVVGTNHQATRPKGLKPGETMLFNGPLGIQIYLSNAGIAINAGGLPVVCNNATNFTVNCTGIFKVVAPGGVQFVAPTLTNTGDIQDNTETNDKTMAVMREDYDEHGHPIVNVQTGGATIVSGTPTVIE
jgi:phage baseplate assembly protein V